MFSKNILIVDDEEQIRELLFKYFNRIGFSVQAVSSGKEALEKIKSFIPNLILLDYMMPGETGLTIFPQLKHLFPFVKVVILTGRGSEEIAVKALKMGVDDYITKPFELTEIRDLVWQYLDRQREELIWLNGKYYYPLEDEFVNRYEYLRLVHSRPELGVKTVSSFFSFTRQDFYNYLKKFKELGLIGIIGKRELKKLITRFGVTRLNLNKLPGFQPFPFLEEETEKRTYCLRNFLNWKDPAQVKLEMIREVATDPKPHVGLTCKKYKITREGFYQNYRAFEARGIFGLLRKMRGRPRKVTPA
ncbi:MAG: response regulator [Candidatus Euphemobacter frigidus]|nr:response regulator [Candidatus Euphemobacter frigidus]